MERFNGIHQNLKRLLVTEELAYAFITPFSLVFSKDSLYGSKRFSQLKLAGFGNIIKANEAIKLKEWSTGAQITRKMRETHSYVLKFYNKRFKKNICEITNLN